MKKPYDFGRTKVEKGNIFDKNYELNGLKFYDNNTKREMMLVYDGEYKDWIVYKHPDGQWVSLRKATDEDRIAISSAVSNVHHFGA